MTYALLLLIVLLCILVNADNLCNKCQRNYAACLDERSFKMCTAGKPDDKINLCPAGYICTSKTSICVPQSETNPITPSCGMTCGLCKSPGKLFSCLSNTTYAFCFGKDEPDLSAKGVCPNGCICNLNDREVCKKASSLDLPSCNAELAQEDFSTSTSSGMTESSITTFKPKVTDGYIRTTTVATKEELTTDGGVTKIETTSLKPTTKGPTPSTLSTPIETTSPTTTTVVVDIPGKSSTQSTTLSSTTQSSGDGLTFCEGKQADGQYRSESDPTCQKFILCYFLAGQYLELQYTCPGSDFFNDQTKNCQTKKPLDC